MDRPEIERRTLAYLDEHDGEAVELLRGLRRVRSVAREEGTARLPGTIVARLGSELGYGGVSEVVAQGGGPGRQTLLGALGRADSECSVGEARLTVAGTVGTA